MAFVRGVENRNFLPLRRRPSPAHRISFIPLHFRQTEMVMSPADSVLSFCLDALSIPSKVCGVRKKNSEHVAHPTIFKELRALEHIINPLFENLIKGIREVDEVPFLPGKKVRAAPEVRTTYNSLHFNICSFIFPRHLLQIFDPALVRRNACHEGG